MCSMITGKNYIGSRLSSAGKVTFKTFNPQTNRENEPLFIEASVAEINESVALAEEAFKVFRNISGLERSVFLEEIARELEALGDELIQTYCEESGLPQGRAVGERGRTLFQLRSFAALLQEGSWIEASIDTAVPERQPVPKPDLRKMLMPLGPVVVFGASNFPLAYSTAGGDTASALAAGCPVIVKSHPMHAGTGELVASAVIKAAQKTGMPEGVFSNLNSSGIEVGGLLVKHPGVKAVGFTGSIGGGRALYNMASQRAEPIPVFAEMGSINPVIILPEAIKRRSAEIAKIYANSITAGSGQFCTNPGLLIGIKSEGLHQFMKNLFHEIIKIEPSCMLHPNILGAYEKNREKALSQGGIQVVGEFEAQVPVNYGRQTLTTVDGQIFLENPNLHQEVFGPYSLIVQCEDLNQMEKIISKLEGQLTGTVMAEEHEASEHAGLISALQNRVGRIIFNGVPTGVEVCPSMTHGGPYPASTDSRFTAVGINAIKRWVRPFSFQDWPDRLLPEELKNGNTLKIYRLVNNVLTNKPL